MTIINKAMSVAKLDTGITDAESAKQLSSFVDGSSVSDWAEPAVAVTVKSGIVSGYDGNLSPRDNVTRAETAVMVRNTLKTADLI